MKEYVSLKVVSTQSTLVKKLGKQCAHANGKMHVQCPPEVYEMCLPPAFVCVPSEKATSPSTLLQGPFYAQWSKYWIPLMPKEMYIQQCMYSQDFALEGLHLKA